MSKTQHVSKQIDVSGLQWTPKSSLARYNYQLIIREDAHVSAESDRIAALHRLGILNSNTNEYLDSITRLVADIYNVPGVFLTFLDSERQWVKSSINRGPLLGFNRQNQTFCDYTIRNRKVVIVDDAAIDPRFCDDPLVAQEAGVRFFAGAPLVTPEGHAVGVLCVADTQPRTFSRSERNRLSEIAVMVMSYLLLIQSVGHVDSISGMPNKYQMAEDLDKQGKRCTGQKRVLVEIDMLDASRALEIARVLGAITYDHLIRSIGNRLQRLFEHEAHVYHLTDARFAILSHDDSTEKFMEYLYELEDRLQAPMTDLPVPLPLQSFGGIVVFNLCPNAVTDAPRKAASAANQALLRQQRWSVYNNTEDEKQQRTFRLINDVWKGISSGQFELVYQPKHDLTNNACVSAEALLRWNHDQFGFVSPAEFIPLVEKTALMGPLTHWVIHTAIKQVSIWQEQGHFVKVAINLSASSFKERDIVKRLAETCAEYNVDPKYVEIECTEGTWMEGVGVLQTLKDIQRLGMTLALDDFGTGYSNFAYLQSVPATVIKIDQSLIREVRGNSRNQLIVRSLISLAKELEYEVVAEGVEDEQTLALIREWGCNLAQGYFLGKPLNPKALLTHIVKYQTSTGSRK